MSRARHLARFVIGADHPSLPGHFPGQPVVPGVLLLAQVLDAAERWLGRPPGALRLPQVKFLQPLRPGQPAEITLERVGARLRFRIAYAGAPVASGELEFPA